MSKILRRLLNRDIKIEPSLLDKYYGHLNSKKVSKAVNVFNEPIPWYTYPSIDYLVQFELSKKTVFEWGSGNSSLFFAERSKKVISIEHDKGWFEIVEVSKKTNQEIIYRSLNEYPKAIHDTDILYDIIVIDGQRRFDCTIECVDKLQKNGMIILDNSDWFYKSASFLKNEMKLTQIDFHGFSPINNYILTTSIFLSREFDFPIKNNRQPNNPFGGLFHNEYEIMEKEDKIYNTKNIEMVHRLSL